MKSKNNSTHSSSHQDNVYQVQEILKKKHTSKEGDLYLIKWKGYPNPDDYTWQPISHLKEVRHLVRKFNEKWEKKLLEDKKKQLPKMKPIQMQKQKSVIQISSDSPQEKKIPQKQLQVPKEKKISKSRNRHQKRHVHQQKQDTLIVNKQGRKQRKYDTLPNKQAPALESSLHQPTLNTTLNTTISTTANSIEPGLDKPWQKQGLTLGRIHKHFYQDGQLIFNINLNKGEDLICGSVYLTLTQLILQHEQKVIEYMQKWSKYSLIEEQQRNSQYGLEFQQYWRNNV